jgi:hypothetical protein
LGLSLPEMPPAAFVDNLMESFKSWPVACVLVPSDEAPEALRTKHVLHDLHLSGLPTALQDQESWMSGKSASELLQASNALSALAKRLNKEVRHKVGMMHHVSCTMHRPVPPFLPHFSKDVVQQALIQLGGWPAFVTGISSGQDDPPLYDLPAAYGRVQCSTCPVRS